MTDDPDHLDYFQVQRLLSFVASYQPIIVGGQSVNIYSLLYAGREQKLDELGPLTSKDIDFFENAAAAEALADNLDDAMLELPGLDDFTPEAAKVSGSLDEKHVVIDFMRSIKGVKAEKIPTRAVQVQDPENPGTSLWLMHPLDCVRSRLANINDLGRTSEHSVTQAEASLLILGLFVEDELSDADGGPRRVMRVAQELEHVLTDMHFGRTSHHNFGDRLNPLALLEKLEPETRLDERWREKTLAGFIKRCREKLQIEIDRRERFNNR